MNLAKERASLRISLLAMFSVLAFLSALFVKLTVSYGAIVYALVLLTGVLVVGFPLSATIISIVAGLLYSFQSFLFLLILGAFVVRGAVVDFFFNLLGVYRDARVGKYNAGIITATMILSSFFAGLYQYFFITLFLHKLIDFGTFIVSTIFIVAIVSNAIAGYVVPKYVMPRIHISS